MMLKITEKCIVKGESTNFEGIRVYDYETLAVEYIEAVTEFITNPDTNNVHNVHDYFEGVWLDSAIVSIKDCSYKEEDDTVYRLCHEDVDMVIDDYELKEKLDELGITNEKVYSFIKNKMEIPWTEYVEASIEDLISRTEYINERNGGNKNA